MREPAIPPNSRVKTHTRESGKPAPVAPKNSGVTREEP
jgi:hypothetical protein